MLKITEWTRKAYQKIEYNTLENGDKQYFVIQIDHDNGRYKARWEMITEERRNGYLSTLSVPMAEYNGQTTLKDGRFNRKWLEKADLLLENSKEKYFSLWKQEKYQELCNEIHNDINKMN